MGVAAYLAHIVIGFGQASGVFQSLFVQVGVDFFHLVGKVKILGNRSLPFGLGLLDHGRIHIGEFVGFAFNGGLEVGHGVADFASVFQMGVCVHGFCGGCGAKQLGNLVQTFFIGSSGKSKVLTVGLGFTSKSGHKIFVGGAHWESPLLRSYFYQEQFLFKEIN